MRDGEPLGTVADGVEWALLENIHSPDGKHVSGVCEDAAGAAAVDASACSGLTRCDECGGDTGRTIFMFGGNGLQNENPY